VGIEKRGSNAPLGRREESGSGQRRDPFAPTAATAAVDQHDRDGEHYYNEQDVGGVELHFSLPVSQDPMPRTTHKTPGISPKHTARRTVAALNQALL